MPFEVKKDQREGKVLLKFRGLIDEEAVFPEVEDLGGDVFVDLEQVRAISSIGIRAWILWFTEQETTSFTFINCPKSLVMQMNMVEGFLPSLSLPVPARLSEKATLSAAQNSGLMVFQDSSLRKLRS